LIDTSRYTFVGLINNVTTKTTINKTTVPTNNPVKSYLAINIDPINGPNRNPKLNIERSTVFANIFKRVSLLLFLLTDSLADAYNCGSPGAPREKNTI